MLRAIGGLIVDNIEVTASVFELDCHFRDAFLVVRPIAVLLHVFAVCHILRAVLTLVHTVTLGVLLWLVATLAIAPMQVHPVGPLAIPIVVIR